MLRDFVVNSSTQANFDLPASLLETIRHMRKTIQSILLGAVIVCLVSGCSNTDKPPNYVNVSGTVNFDGKPLTDANITFNTDGRAPSVIQIIDGQYNGQAMIGSNRISISAKRKVANASTKPISASDRGRMESYKNQPGYVAVEEGEETIPPDFGANSKQTRVIEAGVQNKFDFDIKHKK